MHVTLLSVHKVVLCQTIPFHPPRSPVTYIHNNPRLQMSQVSSKARGVGQDGPASRWRSDPRTPGLPGAKSLCLGAREVAERQEPQQGLGRQEDTYLQLRDPGQVNESRLSFFIHKTVLITTVTHGYLED